MILAGILVACSGVAIGYIGVIGWLGRLRRNRWNGIRTRATQASDDAWSVAHRVGGPFLVIGGLAWIGAGVAVAANAQAIGWAVFTGGLALVVVGGIQGDRAARK